MIVRNWMNPNPTTIDSGMLLAEAYRIFSAQNIRAMPVVDNGTLRGLLTRAHCLLAAENVARTQNNHEFDYFANKLKVKDIMVRHPATVDVGDTMEYCMRVGQEERKSQFPVLDNGKVVGIITATEIFSMAAHIIGAWHNYSGVTLEASSTGSDDMNRIATIVDNGGAGFSQFILSGERTKIEYESSSASKPRTRMPLSRRLKMRASWYWKRASIVSQQRA